MSSSQSVAQFSSTRQDADLRWLRVILLHKTLCSADGLFTDTDQKFSNSLACNHTAFCMLRGLQRLSVEGSFVSGW